jgi:hypothetical protein
VQANQLRVIIHDQNLLHASSSCLPRSYALL